VAPTRGPCVVAIVSPFDPDRVAETGQDGDARAIGVGSGAMREPDPALAMRSRPEDFVVVEEPLYPASGEGGHTFVFLEKCDRTTEQVARDLARAVGVDPRDVGYAGRKDRHAVTRQWLSLPGVDPERVLAVAIEGGRVLEARAHGHKLRTGQLRANRFEIVLRGARTALDLPAVEARAAALVRRGLPNRFGEQRFGRHGANADRAREMLASGRGPRDRRAARFLVSALQSEVFNAVLDARREAWDEVELGDLARVEQSGGLFWVDDLERDRARARDFEISATGPIFGRKMREPKGEIAALEARVFDSFGLPPIASLRWPRGVRADGTRRPLRVAPGDLTIDVPDPVVFGADAVLRIRCALPPGAYVTVLIEALVGRVRDAARSAHERRDRDAARPARSTDDREIAGVCSPDVPSTPEETPS